MKYKICISITETNSRKALSAVKKACKLADLVELRLDFLQDLNEKNLKKLIKACKKPVIATCRKQSDGGKIFHTGQERFQILQNAIKFGAELIDLELSSANEMLYSLKKNAGKTKFILSYHNFHETPLNAKLETVLNEMIQFTPDFVKVFCKAQKLNDVVRLFESMQKTHKKSKTVFGLIGELGEPSRILAPFFGGEWTYAALEKGKESAEGQLTVQELLKIYRVKRFKSMPRIFTGIGNPITQSKGPVIHNAALQKAKINALMLKVKVEELNDFKQFFNYFQVEGSSITLPWKQEIMHFMNSLNPAVKKINAMNTVVKRKGKLIGFNTDFIGAVNSLKTVTKLKGKKVALFGAGGAAKAIAFGLKQEKAQVTIINRTKEKAQEIASRFEQKFVSLDSLKTFNEKFEVIINSTSIGMVPKINESIVPEKFLKKGAIVFDCVYNPLKTKLLKTAEKKGCKTVSGIEMFIEQAAEQFKLWHGKQPNKKLMKQVLLKELNKN